MRYKDTWNHQIPNSKLAVYKVLIDDGKITNHHVTYNRQNKTTTVEYDADEATREEMRRRSHGNG